MQLYENNNKLIEEQMLGGGKPFIWSNECYSAAKRIDANELD
jgi:hypothetical protein